MPWDDRPQLAGSPRRTLHDYWWDDLRARAPLLQRVLAAQSAAVTTAPIDVRGRDHLAVQASGTFAGTLTVEGTLASDLHDAAWQSAFTVTAAGLFTYQGFFTWVRFVWQPTSGAITVDFLAVRGG